MLVHVMTVNIPILNVLVDDYLVLEHFTVCAAENIQLFLLVRPFRRTWSDWDSRWLGRQKSIVVIAG